MNFVCSVVPSFFRRQTFFKSLQFVQSVVYKSSYLLKYDKKLHLPWESVTNFLSHPKWRFAKKKICFQWDYYGLLVLKLAFEIRAVSLDFPSEFAEVIFSIFSC